MSEDPDESRGVMLSGGELERINRAKLINNARPEWVMLGAEWDGPGVLLLASQTLIQADLDFRARQYDFGSWEEFLGSDFRPELTLSVHMEDDWVLVAGPTYADCLAELLQTWRPDDRPRRKAVGPGKFLP